MLALTVLAERLKVIARRQPEVAQIGGGIEIAKLAARDLDQIGREALRAFTVEHGFGDPILEGLDHDVMYQLMIHTSSYCIAV